jgi:hypothetical protein
MQRESTKAYAKDICLMSCLYPGCDERVKRREECYASTLASHIYALLALIDICSA